MKSKWSKWETISTGAVNEHRFVLQVRKHKNGRIKLKCRKSNDSWGCRAPSKEECDSIS
ncbi:MAG: hypothetical protein ACI9N9_000041 [Enterobacterales bacterium]|jgi:hypothetical protein